MGTNIATKNYRQQIRLLTQTRIHLTDEIYLLRTFNEDMKNAKPNKAFEKGCVEICTKIMNEMFKIMIEVGLKDRERVEKEWMSEGCVKRDEILERLTTMSMKYLKSSYHIL